MKYLKIDGVDGDYFECTPYRGTFSVDACAKNWRSARGTVENCNRILCRECDIGALHAGALPVREVARHMCARCGRTDQRLIRGAICVSCYNRERELLIGMNAKGSYPTHAKRLHSVDYDVQGGGHAHLDRFCSPVEAAVLAFRSCSGKAVRMLTSNFLLAGSRKRQHKIFVTGLLTHSAPVQLRLF